MGATKVCGYGGEDARGGAHGEEDGDVVWFGASN